MSSELAERVKEIARSMQASYQADIDLLTRRDKAHMTQIAELQAEIDRLTRQVESLTGELAIAQDTIVELYDAMNTRDNCPDCGGDGTNWSLVGEEAEPESCQCSLDVYDLLLKHGNLVMTVKEIRRKQEVLDNVAR